MHKGLAWSLSLVGACLMATIALGHAIPHAPPNGGTQAGRTASGGLDDQGNFAVVANSPATNRDTSVHIEATWDQNGEGTIPGHEGDSFSADAPGKPKQLKEHADLTVPPPPAGTGHVLYWAASFDKDGVWQFAITGTVNQP